MEKDIRDKVISDFGEVSKVLIKKDSARGFGFVNFRPPEEARNAMEANFLLIQN